MGKLRVGVVVGLAQGHPLGRAPSLQGSSLLLNLCSAALATVPGAGTQLGLRGRSCPQFTSQQRRRENSDLSTVVTNSCGKCWGGPGAGCARGIWLGLKMLEGLLGRLKLKKPR